MPRSSAPDPVFVGGCPRSGTTILGRLIGSHPRYAAVPVEIRFHSEPKGLSDLLDGQVGVDEFLDRLLNHWYSRRLPDGARRGFPDLIDRDDLEAAAEAFSASFERDPISASRALVRAVLDPVAERAGKASWVEMTPWTVARAPTLAKLFPDACFVHVIRDGRDVACSVATLFWGPETADAAIPWWEQRLRDAQAGADRLPAGRVLVIELEDLVERDRGGAYRRLLDFLGVEDDPGMRSFFDLEMTAGNAHIGRWREDLPASERDRLQRLYGDALARLKRL